LATPTELFDPFDGLDLGRELRRALPDRPGRFAPLLGMVLAELEETGHAIDFLHPRRRPEPPSRRKKLVIAGVTAALVAVVAAVAFGRVYRGWLNNRIEQLAKESEELDEELSQAEKDAKAVAAIEKWTATDVVWLDELRMLSEDFPPAKEAMLTSLTCSKGAPGGKMELKGLAENGETIGPMEEGLRNESRRVKVTGDGEDRSQKFYTWRFTSLVFVSEEQ
jgi:Tfp pilus assembly protein PilN